MCKRLLFFVFFGEKIPFRPRRTGLKRPDGARLFGDGRFEAGASACGRRFRSGRCLWCPGSFGAFRSPDRGRVRTISRRRRSLAGPFIRRFVRGLRPARSRRRGSCGLFRISVRVLFTLADAVPFGRLFGFAFGWGGWGYARPAVWRSGIPDRRASGCFDGAGAAGVPAWEESRIPP